MNTQEVTTDVIARAMPLGDIVESKTNPRKTFTDVKELAVDLKQHGVLQPVLVRPHPSGDGHELVFGARRFRAAKLAGLATIPAMVRDLDDATMLEFQIVENAKRADIHPLEEADGYAMLHDKYGFTHEEIAAKVGKSSATIAQRLRFATLVKPARAAFLEGKLTAATALMIARLPQDAQADATKVITTTDRRGDVPSASEAAEIIAEEFTLLLRDAQFDTKSATLVPAAGSCLSCPKRSKNQAELFADEKSKDVCLDKKCFRSKLDATWKIKKAEAEKLHLTVLDGTQAETALHSRGSGFRWLDSTDYSDSKQKTWRDKIGKKDVPIILARGDDGEAVELVRETDLKKAGVIRSVAPSSSTSDEEKKRQAKYKRDGEKRREQIARLATLASNFGNAAEEFEFSRAIARGVVRVVASDTAKLACKRREVDWGKHAGPREALIVLVSKLTLGGLRGLVVELLAEEEASRKEFAKLLEDGAK